METKRPISPGLEALLHEPFQILDHGHLVVRDYMGNDESVEQAARVSYSDNGRKVNDRQGLINYLMSHRHTSPFEMCEIQLDVKLPIFVARQWIRHRTANVNEQSARYSILEKEFYIPKPADIKPQAVNNKQGRDGEVSAEYAERVRQLLLEDSLRSYETYETLLDDGEGIARELARMSLSLNYYTRWIWKIDLHNLFHFLKLRNDPHAQYEIRVYAEQILEFVKAWVPLCANAWEQFVAHNIQLTLPEQKLFGRVLEHLLGYHGKGVVLSEMTEWARSPALGLSTRQQQEALAKFQKLVSTQL